MAKINQVPKGKFKDNKRKVAPLPSALQNRVLQWQGRIPNLGHCSANFRLSSSIKKQRTLSWRQHNHIRGVFNQEKGKERNFIQTF
ncbi:hypothetical protein PIB30_086010, partial [Stylosanthes scabra]|nr:hypothetical protein [Stylosanthes scabra]